MAEPVGSALVERIEAASQGIEQELIHEAFRLIYPRAKVTRVPGFEQIGDGIGPYTDEHRGWQALDARMTKLLCAGGFLDAAMTLVPEGWRTAMVSEMEHRDGWHWRLGWKMDATPRFGMPAVDGIGATPAFALTAAALKARALTQGEEK